MTSVPFAQSASGASLWRLLSASMLVALTACGQGTLEEGDESETLETTEAALTDPVRGMTLKAVETVSIRAGPGSEYETLARANAGHTATLLHAVPESGYYRVSFQGRRGWTPGGSWASQPGLVVYGTRLNATQEKHVRYLGRYVVPKLLGTYGERLDIGARVSWWSLKEGVLSLSNPHVYSNCHYPSGDVRLSPLAVCPYSIWQAGSAGVQVWDHPALRVQEKALQLFPGKTLREILAATAITAGFEDATSTHATITGSTGDLRHSWLMRNPRVGFTFQDPTVKSECVTSAFAWCYGTGWQTTAQFAPSRAAALRAISELRSIFDGLQP